ncbi:hypothetical protein [Parasedimentitalea psychrophila]|uniref:Uncharacterized protein n=1 Tax=Parasedimentitalea psychrophila TaxID=2997337 RepID=A0A9Y2P8N0_9RHOB|nr:hypothetical protein [Parasedimentitalea psychrophila]WIY27075.1 hypothetical protein QPJ95_09260 [Parasedimentitalea psychrophila]
MKTADNPGDKHPEVIVIFDIEEGAQKLDAAAVPFWNGESIHGW